MILLIEHKSFSNFPEFLSFYMSRLYDFDMILLPCLNTKLVTPLKIAAQHTTHNTLLLCKLHYKAPLYSKSSQKIRYTGMSTKSVEYTMFSFRSAENKSSVATCISFLYTQTDSKTSQYGATI